MHVEWKTVTVNPQVTRKKEFAKMCCTCNTSPKPEACASDFGADQSRNLSASCAICFRCACADGYTGTTCEDDLDECADDSTCLNGATCINTVGGHSCVCPADYTGSRCETDMHRCRSSPCHNDGACVDLPDYFRCECRRGFTGLLCEADVDECATAPCANGGLCVNQVINPLVTWCQLPTFGVSQKP